MGICTNLRLLNYTRHASGRETWSTCNVCYVGSCVTDTILITAVIIVVVIVVLLLLILLLLSSSLLLFLKIHMRTLEATGNNSGVRCRCAMQPWLLPTGLVSKSSVFTPREALRCTARDQGLCLKHPTRILVFWLTHLA